MPTCKLAITIVIFCLLFPVVLLAQNTANRGWIFLSHKQKLSGKWDILADAQLRSADKFKSINTLLLRSGLSYNFNKQHSVALGYTYKGDWEHDDSKIHYEPENRIYEQYLFSADIKKVELTARFRFEQRFIKEEKKYLFSQRARGFLSLQIPLIANTDFSKGMYTTVQNEIFINIQHKENVNNDFFDQNRAQVALGYRWSKMLDTDIAYMFWRQKEMDGYTSSNVFQLTITTEL